MTLSARIALRPSRRLALIETLFPVAGLVIAASTFAERWPGASPATFLSATVAIGAVLAWSWRCWTARRAVVVTVSHYAEVGIAGSEDIWRIAEPSLVRPGIAVLALRSDHVRALVMPILDADLAGADRRALHRFLGWCLRGGAAMGT